MHGDSEKYLELHGLDLPEVTAWLEEEFGPEGERWVFVRHLLNNYVQRPYLVYIFNEEDVTAAKLRWA